MISGGHMMKRFIRVAMLLCVGTVLLSTLSLKTIEAKTTLSSGKVSQNRFSSISCGKWSVVPSPNPPVMPSGLSAVAAVSATDVWAVGSSGSQTSGGQTLIEQWNGTQWQIVKSPSPGSDYNTLTGVAVVSASDVWAVGWQANRGLSQTLIEHWNGTQWLVVNSPSPGSVNNELFSLTAVSASNVWAVGFITINKANGPVERTLIEQWNGTRWSVVKSPSPGSQTNNLAGVAAVSATDVWAVGFYANSSNIWQALTEQWNGTHWSVVKSFSPGSQINYFSSAAVVSTNNVWAVGYSDKQMLTEQWDGKQWSDLKSFGPGSVSNLLLGVTAVSASDIWTVGSYQNRNFVSQTLTEQWNGKQWGVVKSPSPGTLSTQLSGVAAISPTDVWAVGHADSNTLIEHYHC
jgi:hypothetical protein